MPIREHGALFCAWALLRVLQTCGARLKLREDVENGGHNDTWEVGGQSYYNKLREFIVAALSESTASSDMCRHSAAHSTISDASTSVSLRQPPLTAPILDDKDL